MDTQITLQLADYRQQAEQIHGLRHAVFVLGQGIDPALERDPHDADAVHVLAIAADGQTVGTGRLVIAADGHSGRIGRMAVLPAARGQGVGTAMLHWLGEQARQRGLGTLSLHAQLPALPLYLRAGYLPAGEPVVEAGIAHQPLRRRLDGSMKIADQASAQAALATIISTTGRQLCLLAPALDPGLLDAPLVLDSLRSLVARRQPLQIRLLVDDPERIARSGGPVLALIQRRPGAFVLRQRDLAACNSSEAIACNDRGHALLRDNAELPAGEAGLPWRPFSQRLQQRLDAYWEGSSNCPELQPLRL
ncbi:MAG: GNAT family N-acetyltransferase [Stenotrophomonas sp.]